MEGIRKRIERAKFERRTVKARQKSGFSEEQKTVGRVAGDLALQSTRNKEWDKRWWDAQDDIAGQPRIPGVEGDLRAKASRRKEVIERNFPTPGTRAKSAEAIHRGIYETGIPTESLPALSTVMMTHKDGYAGFARAVRLPVSEQFHPHYTDGAVSIKDTAIKGNDKGRAQIIAHELGHTAEQRAKRGLVGITGDRDSHAKRASAAGEGFADGVSLRFHPSPRATGPKAGDPQEIHTWVRDTYSPDDWSDPESKVSYLAHRALAWDTGGRPKTSGNFQGIHKQRESVHNAALASPHVIEAVKSWGLSETAQHMSDQFREMHKIGTQLSLFGPEHDRDEYSVEAVDWGGP